MFDFDKEASTPILDFNACDASNSRDIVKFKPSKRTNSWECYLFGSDKEHGWTYYPADLDVPNFFVRFLMGVCFGCKWRKIT